MHYDRVLDFDWTYFNSFSFLLKSIILEYHRFPVHDPWVCGGVDILSEPQIWVFSPFMITTLLLSPYVANLSSFILLSFIGAWGMIKLLKYYKVSDLISIYCSLLFINSSWFGLHITEGHIAFRDFLLLPLFVYLVLTLNSIKKLFYVLLLMAYFLVDGAIYTFIYGLVLGFFLALFKMIPVKELYFSIKENILTALLAIISFLLISSVKVIPVLASIAHPRPIRPFRQMTVRDIVLSLFYPLQTNISWNQMQNLRFHEIGCYIGILSLGIICFFLRKKSLWREYWKELLLIVIFFWMATGIGGEINPSAIIRKIPLIGQVDIESRYLILFIIFYILILAIILNRYIKSRWLLITILILLNMEFLFVKDYSSFIAFHNYYNKIDYPTYITKRNISQTLQYVPKPQVYFLDNIASKECYEPMTVDSHVRFKNQRHYKGEAYPYYTRGNINILEFSPGFIKADYHLWHKGYIVLNTNSNNSWIVNKPNKIKKNNKNLLEVTVVGLQGTLTLIYRPWYLKYIIIFYISGIILTLIVIWRIYFSKNRI